MAQLFEATDSQKYLPDAPGRKRGFLVCQNHLEALILLELYKQKLFERATIGLSMAASCGLVALTGPTSDWSLLELTRQRKERCHLLHSGTDTPGFHIIVWCIRCDLPTGD